MGLRLNGENKVILRVQMRHGDVITMCGTQLQALTKVSILFPSSGGFTHIELA